MKRALPYEDSTCTPSAEQFAKRHGVDTHKCRLVLAADKCESDEWPRHVANEMCVRCLQIFSGQPWPRPHPIMFSAREQTYRCAGFLCGPACAKAMARELRGRHQDVSLMAMLARDYFGVELADVKAAPPTALLPVLVARHQGNVAAAVAEYRHDAPPLCEPMALLPFVRTTFFLQMTRTDQREEQRRAQNSHRLQQQPVALLQSTGGKQVLRRKSAQPAVVPSAPSAPAAAAAAPSITSLLGIKRVQKNSLGAKK